MPRKASQAAKKETSVETKNEGGSTRRSGRATTKQEPVKEASRSRRSSTAAQTAASVADSKTPKRSTSSRRDSTSPSEGRQKSRRGSVESPATRVKSTRRATGRINYKESDGEDDNAAPKYDDNFESNEEFEDSDTDEKNKAKGRTRGVKSPAKGRASQSKAKGRGRRGRPKKQSSDEEEGEPIELSEESVEIESETIGTKTEEPKETTRSGRGRKPRSSVETKSPPADKPKSSRRSARSTSAKEEPPKKRPSRSLQAKKYTEEDDDDVDDEVEEIHDSKSEDEAKPTDSARKRKRGAASEASKKLKEEEDTEKKEEEGEDDKEPVEKNTESKSVSDSETEGKKKEPVDKAMEVEDSADGSKIASSAKEEVEEKTEGATEEKKENKKAEGTEESAFNISKEKLKLANKQASLDSSENLDESMQSFDSDQGSRAEQSISSGLEDSQDSKQTKSTENAVSGHEASAPEKAKSPVNYQPESSNSFQELDDSSESKSMNESGGDKESKQDSSVDKKEVNLDSKNEVNKQNDASTVQESKPVESDKVPVVPAVSAGLTGTSNSKESSEVSLNGSEKMPNATQVIHNTSVINLHSENSAPKANGAHDLHNNSVPENDQYYPFPGRKYVMNTKLGDTVRQSVKDKSFGFVSYNLGMSSSDSSIQKEKLLNEFNKLDAHIICIQQVSKSFYSGFLESSLDALGFKGTFSQQEDSEKGVATFYKSSLFRLTGQSETSLKHLIEKELEASSLDSSDQTAVKTYVKKCGHVLFTHFATVIGMHSLTVANVQVPPTDLSIHALQVSCLVREVVKVNDGTSRPFLLGGEFNMNESEAPYQLLRDGYLSDDMIEELQRRKDVILPGKENAALVNLLWKSFQHPSSTLCSCYKSVLDHEVFIPEQKITSRDLLWYSSDSLYTVGVLDASETLRDHHFSLKADVAFSV